MPLGQERRLSGPGTASDIHPAALEIARQIRRWDLPDVQPATAVLTTQQFLVDGGGSVITTGIKGGAPIDYPARISRVKVRPWDVAAGSIVFDIQKAADGSNTFASICGGNYPTITSSTTPYIDNVLTGWTTVINRSDDLRFHVLSVTGFALVTLSLRLRRLDLTALA